MAPLISKRINALSMIIVSGVLTFGTSTGWAQEKQKISYKEFAANSKYTRQYTLDVEDVPGHQLRILEIHRTFPKDTPVFAGVPVAEEWVRGYSDYIDINGRSWGYGHYVLKNGDKIFSRYDGTSQTAVQPDGSKKDTFTQVITLTGGTGKFLGIRGTLRSVVVFDPKTGFNEGQVEGEYWLQK